MHLAEPLMLGVGGLLIYLAIKRDMEPALLCPWALEPSWSTCPCPQRGITTLFNMGIASELFPLLLFIGIGAMMDFGPCWRTPSFCSLARRPRRASS